MFIGSSSRKISQRAASWVQYQTNVIIQRQISLFTECQLRAECKLWELKKKKKKKKKWRQSEFKFRDRKEKKTMKN